MKIGCSVLDISELKTVKAAGYDYLEMKGKYLAQLTEADFGRVYRCLQERQFLCGGLNAYCPEAVVIAGPGYDRKRVKSYAEVCAARAAAVGVRVVGIGSPRSRTLPEGFARQKADQQLMDFLKTTAESFGKFGIRICLEPLAPCYCNYINTLGEAAEIVDRIGWENIGLVADFYNMEYTQEADGDITPFLPWLYHVHISDDAGGADRRSYLKAERACAHRARIVRLYQSGYRGAVSMEMDVPASLAPAIQSFELLKQAIGSCNLYSGE